MYYQQAVGKYTIYVSRGSFTSREEKLVEMHLFRGSLHSCIWELFFPWILVVLFCRRCRALLPHLEESAIFEHFIYMVSSRCPCLRDQNLSHSSYLVLAFVWLLITCLSFSVFSFLFCFFSELVTCVCCQCTHQGGDWGPKRLRTGGWSLLAVMCDWQCGVDWLLAEYCRWRLRLDLRWCRWRAGAKGLGLAGPPRSGETSRVGSRDPVVKCEPHGGKKSKRKSWTGAGAR
jgi:hypothetical protein